MTVVLAALNCRESAGFSVDVGEPVDVYERGRDPPARSAAASSGTACRRRPPRHRQARSHQLARTVRRRPVDQVRRALCTKPL